MPKQKTKGTDNVYLVFSVNKSGEFLGVARMTSQTGPGPMLNWSIHDTARRHALGGVMGVEWILCQRLPFSVVRHIANPWNQNKEVKVSRDGTELEPTVGQQLISEFIRFHDMQEALVRHGGAPQYPLPKRFVAYIPTFATGV
ncbi:YT521-B-like domain-containing protein [Blastocladiella britannica]|nr:YT521-B-like domain-containing protein [Blastocladiella britannica]